jgi:Zn-dependent alcohol dehydrogenase
LRIPFANPVPYTSAQQDWRQKTAALRRHTSQQSLNNCMNPLPTAATSVAPDYILQTSGLSKSFSGFTAVNGVNLAIRRGSIHALIGPNGAGKTTCFNLPTKFLKPTAGRIVFDGVDITGLRPAEIARQGVIRSFQISAVFPHMSVLDNVRVGLQRRLGTSFHFWRPMRSLDRLNGQALALLDEVGLVDHALEMVGSAKALEFAYKVTRRGGTTVTVGLPASSQNLTTPVWHLVAEERTLKGSYLGSCVPRRDIGRFVSLYRTERLPVDRLLTGTLTLDQINEGFDRLQRGEAIRQVILMNPEK